MKYFSLDMKIEINVIFSLITGFNKFINGVI
jgi:hypothetical protein